MCFDLEGNNGIPVKSCNKPHFCEYHPLDLSTHSPRMKSCPIREQKDPVAKRRTRRPIVRALRVALRVSRFVPVDTPSLSRPRDGWGNNTGRRRCKSLNEMEMDLEIRDKRISMGIEFIRFRCSYKSREEDVGEVSLRTKVVNSLKRLKFPLLFSFLSVFSFLRKKEGKRWMIEGRERKR